MVTGDGVLAFAMHLSGVPFADESLWCVNYYTADILRKLGYSGLSMREGAIRAVKDGKPGVLRFMLARPENEVIEAYAEQEREITAEGTDVEAQVVLRQLLEDYRAGARPYGETVAKIACLILKMRIQFMNAWKDTVPLLRIDGQAQPEHIGMDGSKTVEMGGFKLISVNASDEIRKRMGL
jgi:hypothetical protein